MDTFKHHLPWLLVGVLVCLCRWASAEAPVSWANGTFEAAPAGSDLASTIDNKMRELKSTVRDYGEAEMCWGDANSTGCSKANSGETRLGSCRTFFETTAPTTIKGFYTDGTQTLSNGRLFVDSNYLTDVPTARDNHLYVYDAAFEEVDGVPAADRTSWVGSTNQLTEHLLAVRATTSATRDVVSVSNCGTVAAVNWDTESFDDSTMHDNVTNNTRLTTPSGATRVRLHANIVTGTGTSFTYMNFIIKQDGAGSGVTKSNFFQNNGIGAGGTPIYVLESGPIAVTGGTTYFEVFPDTTNCTVLNGNGPDVVQTSSWFSMEVIQ